MRLWRALGVVAVSLLSSSPVLADGFVGSLEVEAVIIRPIQSDGRYWDGIDTRQVPEQASRAIQREATKLAAAALGELGVAQGLTGIAGWITIEAAKMFIDATRPPDPFGELVVDSKVVATLPVVQDKVAPAWPAHRATFVPLSAASVVELTLIDADIDGAHDPIGTCSFTIPEPSQADQPTTRIKSSSCTGDILAAGLLVAREAEPTHVEPGAYAIRIARAGINPAKADGRPWDENSIGDPKIRIEVDGRRVRECSASNGQRASVCAPKGLEVNVSAATSIKFTVVESDAMFDDAVGSASVDNLVGSPAGAPISMTVTGSVAWAELVLEPVAVK